MLIDDRWSVVVVVAVEAVIALIAIVLLVVVVDALVSVWSNSFLVRCVLVNR